MAEEYCGGANWWDNRGTIRNTRFDSGGGSTASSAITLANSSGGGGTTGYGWLTESTTTDTKLDPSSIQLMGLGLSNSPSMEWNQQHILNSEKTENNFRSMMQDGGGGGLPPNFQENGVIFGNNNNRPPPQWRPAEKLFPNDHEESSEFKHQITGGVRGFSLDQNNPQFSQSCSSIESSITCNNNNNQGFQLDSSLSPSVVYGSPSSILQGLMGHPDQQHSQQHLTNNYPQQQQQQSNYFDIPQFLKTPSPKQQQQQQQLQFMNNGPYWNASGSGGVGMNDNVRPNFFSSLQAPSQLNQPSFEEKPKATMAIREMNSISKKSSSQETNSKRARNDGASSTLPPFKVRKEKMGDRITALQQLVSPFGKTDTASVLSEAIEYIKFLHEQVSVLSNPYLKSGAPYQQQQHPGNEKGKIDEEGPKQDLRSRGLCLVPVSSTFPVTHETTVDFWTPTFGGTFR